MLKFKVIKFKIEIFLFIYVYKFLLMLIKLEIWKCDMKFNVYVYDLKMIYIFNNWFDKCIIWN